jgi:hypothetical protein
LLAQAPQQPQQQLEQPRLGGLLGCAGTVRRAQGGQQARHLWPGRPHQLTHGAGTEVGKQRPQRFRDRGVGQGTLTNGHAAARQHPGPVGGAAAGQLGDQAGLADAGLAPHQDDGRFAIRGPPPGRLQEP